MMDIIVILLMSLPLIVIGSTIGPDSSINFGSRIPKAKLKSEEGLKRLRRIKIALILAGSIILVGGFTCFVFHWETYQLVVILIPEIVAIVYMLLQLYMIEKKGKGEEMNIQERKVGVIGCGFVGSSSAFALMQSGLFSEIVLNDVDRERAEGEALDISHGLPFAKPMKIYAGDYDDLMDCSIIVITAGAGQKPGETRLDLVKKNVGIFKSIIPEIAKRKYEGILLIVANPVDILTYVSVKLSGFPENRVFGSGTVLDTARLKYLLGEHLSIDNRSVHAFIIGEHGDSEIAAWSSANVSGIPLNDFCELRGHLEHDASMKRIAEDVKNSAYEIIAKKKATYYGIAMSVRRICEAIIRDEKSILPVSSMQHGEYRISDVSLSVPAIVGRQGVERVVPIDLSEEEKEALQASADTLKKVIDDAFN